MADDNIIVFHEGTEVVMRVFDPAGSHRVTLTPEDASDLAGALIHAGGAALDNLDDGACRP